METINIHTFWKYYFRILWACLNMPDHTQQKLHDSTVALMALQLHLKYKIFTSNNFLDLKYPPNWLSESIFIYNLRTRFFTHIWLLQNLKGNCGASFKTKKAPIVGPNFSKNRYGWFPNSEKFRACFTKLNKNYVIKLQLAWMSNYMQKINTITPHLQIYWKFVILEHLEHAHDWMTTLNKNRGSNCSFYEYPTTCKKWTTHLK